MYAPAPICPTVGNNEKAKTAKAVREAKQDANRDAALKLVDKLNQETAVAVFQQKDTGMKKDNNITNLKQILTQQWAEADEAPAEKELSN